MFRHEHQLPAAAVEAAQLALAGTEHLHPARGDLDPHDLVATTLRPHAQQAGAIGRPTHGQGIGHLHVFPAQATGGAAGQLQHVQEGLRIALLAGGAEGDALPVG